MQPEPKRQSTRGRSEQPSQLRSVQQPNAQEAERMRKSRAAKKAEKRATGLHGTPTLEAFFKPEVSEAICKQGWGRMD